jgi:hypothetical protein
VRSTICRASALTFAVLVVACGKDPADPAASTSGTGETSSTSGDSPSSTTPTDTSASTSADSVTTADTSTTDEPPEGECIVYADECGDDQKCMPWSLQADEIPDDIRCCALADNPSLVGEPCEVLDYNGSCLDTCERGALCMLDDPDALTGQCRAFCQPGADECQPDETCKAFYELLNDVPTVPVCMEQCDPLTQDCAVPSWHCIPDSPTQSGQSGFICVAPPPDEPYGFGDVCALANQCEKGLVCIVADRVPDCSLLSCCTSYCSLSEGNAPCQALHPDMQCVDWMAPDPSWSDVGVCALPDS